MAKEKEEYIIEKYWDAIAGKLAQRTTNILLAGDNDPFYTYKREKFLRLLSSISFEGKKVIEIGPGPGGNLLEIYKQKPSHLTGADISLEMLGICKQTIADKNINLVKINGKDLPFEAGSFDIAVTSAVLQHVTDDRMLHDLVKNICHITRSDVYIFERVEKNHKENTGNTGRTVKTYQQMFEERGMLLCDRRFFSIYWSRSASGFIRKIFNSSKRKEGDPQAKTSLVLQKIILPITKMLDNMFPVKNGSAMLHFKKRKDSA